jgi:hypothetical protein
MSAFLANFPLKRVFLAHPSITGSLFGLLSGFILGILNVPSAVFIFAPLLAGILAGYLRGNGAKAGVLTLLLPILVILTIPIVFPTVDWAASTMPEVEGVGPVGATLAALTNGLIRSTWSVAHGLAAITSALAGILVLILVIMIPILIAVGIVVTAILGFIGGKIGGVIHTYFLSRANVPTSSQSVTTSQPSAPPPLNSCAACNTPIHAPDALYCPNCGVAFPGKTPAPVVTVIQDNAV